MKAFYSLAVFALASVLGASDYRVTLQKPAVINGTKVKADDYKLELNGGKAVLKSGKTSVAADVSVEDSSAKYNSTSACCVAEDGNYHLQEIRLGGTNKKLIFKDKDSATAAGN